MSNTRIVVRTLAACMVVSAVWPIQAQQRELDYVIGVEGDAARGAKLYETCTACHGPRGEGVTDGSVPAIGGQHYLVIVKQLTDFRAEVRPDLRMRHFADTRHLAYSQQIADVSAYISRLPSNAPVTTVRGEAAVRGASLYARHCERCHGATGEGNEESFVPRLAAQHASYLQRQLDDARPGRRDSMTRSHASFSVDLSERERILVTQYLAGTESISRATSPGEMP
jgi:cytochrome c553